ncbi:hypothetical protein BH23CHL8_BH23CHL8_30370 [soil metagenome]
MPTRDPIARIAQNLLTLQRIGNTVDAQLEPIMQELFGQIVADLASIDPTGPGAGRWKRYRTDQLVAEVARRVRAARGEWDTALRGLLAKTGRQQGVFAADTLIFSVGNPGLVRPTPITQARLRAILNTEPFHGRPLSEWADSLERSTRDGVVQQIRLGMSREESIPEIARRLRGEQRGWLRRDTATGQFVPKGRAGAVVAPRFVGGVLTTTTRNAETIARTAVNYVSNVAQMETYEANSRVLDGVQFSATLDLSTTFICASLDGATWKFGDAEIQQPPLHPRCRSALLPVIAWERLGLDAPDEGMRAARTVRVDAEGHVTEGRTTRVQSGTVFEQWMRDRPAKAQDAWFGPARGRLFRSGELTFRDLVSRDGRVIPLAELTG